jgi:hypothetical protein
VVPPLRGRPSLSPRGLAFLALSAILLVIIAATGACRGSAPARYDREDPFEDDSPAVRALLEAAARTEPDGYDDCHGGAESFAIIVVDSVTGEPLARGAKLIWRAGRKVDTAYALPSRTGEEPVVLQGPFGRPGTYDVVIRQLGYRDWHRAGIHVAQGPTHCSIHEGPMYRPMLRALLQRR